MGGNTYNSSYGKSANRGRPSFRLGHFDHQCRQISQIHPRNRQSLPDRAYRWIRPVRAPNKAQRLWSLEHRTISSSGFQQFYGKHDGSQAVLGRLVSCGRTITKRLGFATALLVDIGGGKGHDVQAFHGKYPHRGRLVLQDLPQGLDSMQPGDVDPTVETMVHDFFTQQPVLGTDFIHPHCYSTKKKVFEQPPAKFLQPGADTFFA